MPDFQVTEIYAAGVATPEDEVKVCLKKLSSLMDKEPNRIAIRAAIDDLGHAMEQLPQAEAHLDHIFCEGLYGRKWSAKKGVYIVTETWKVQNISSMIQGKAVIATEEGWKIVEAPAFFITEPGTQRVMFMLEDVVFTTVHPNPTNERDTDKLLESLTTVHKFDKAPGSIGTIEGLL